MQTPSEFPRVKLPGVTVDPILRYRLQRQEVIDQMTAEHIEVQKRGLVNAMIRRGYSPYLGTTGRRRKPTRHVRLMRRLAARSQRSAA